MDMKLRTIAILGWLLLAAGCKQKCYREYEFQHPVSVYPVREVYHIGDTLWVDMYFSDVFDAKVTDNQGREFHESIQLKNFDFYTTKLQIVELKTKALPAFSQEHRWDAFTSIHISGHTEWEGKEGMEYKLLYRNGIYFMKIGLVCNEVGTFLFSPLFYSDYYSPFDQLYETFGQDITPECEKEIITDIRFPVNQQPDGTYLTNDHLFEQYMDTTLENDLDRIRTASFTFVVK
ncbi:MAG: hypothetical protein RLZZ165_777 [Bacteroidota bacterium]|jgi:hypothetical protein